MTKSKNILKIILIACILLLSSVVLFACSGKETKREYTANGKGSIVVENTVDGKVYRAVPDKWFEFVGWYNGNVKYSENPELIIKSSTPAKMEARFATSAKNSANRVLESFYNSYTDGEDKQGEYFNYSLTSDLIYTEGEADIEKDVYINGYIDFNSSSQFAFEVKNENSTDFALYYDDNTLNGTLYLQIEDKKYTFADMGLLTNLSSSLPAASIEAWNIDTFINDENTEYLINQYFGIKNSMGFIKRVDNDETSSIITLSYHKILNFLRNIADDSSDASPIQRLIHALTCEYTNSTLPEMILSIKTNYLKEGEREYVQDITIEFDLDKDYTINFNGEKFTLPKMNATLKINTYNIGFSEEANNISNTILADYPEATVNMINVHTDGELNFISEDNSTGSALRTVVDKYIIELDADLNPLALISYRKNRNDSYYDIEWEKLGFLSFKVSLVPETDADALVAQQERHNNVNDYINILIDTKNNGANAYFFLGLYSPNTLFTQSYLFNHSFNIPALLEVLEGEDSTSNSSTTSNSNSIMNILKTLVFSAISVENNSNPNEVVKDLIIEILTLLNVDTEIINNNMMLTDTGFDLSLADIRTEIRNFEKDIIRETLNISRDLKLDKKLFGDDEENKITHMSINMNTATYNTVVKNQEGDYLNEAGEVIIDNFNKEHKLVVAVKDSSIAEINNVANTEDLLALKGEVVEVNEFYLSDGSIETTFVNNKGFDKVLELIIEDIEIISSIDNVIKVRFLLQTQDYPNSLVPMLGEELYKATGIPYGLIVYETELQIA